MKEMYEKSDLRLMNKELKKMVEQSYKLLTCLDLPYTFKTKPRSESKRKSIQTLAKFINFELPFKKSLRLITDLNINVFVYELDLEVLVEYGYGEFFDLENENKKYIWFQTDSEPYKSVIVTVKNIPIIMSIQNNSDMALDYNVDTFKNLYKKNQIKII